MKSRLVFKRAPHNAVPPRAMLSKSVAAGRGRTGYFTSVRDWRDEVRGSWRRLAGRSGAPAGLGLGLLARFGAALRGGLLLLLLAGAGERLEGIDESREL